MKWDFIPLELLGFLITLLFWEITDPLSLRLRIKTYLSAKIIFLVGFWVILIVVQLLTKEILSWPRTRFDDLISFLGFLLFSFGFFIAVWAKLTMKRNWGVPGQHDIARQKDLVTWGPFSFSRHPIYLGLFLIFLGFSITVRSFLVFLNIIILWRFYKASRVEEKLLEKYFRNKYRSYRQKVPRFLLWL